MSQNQFPPLLGDGHGRYKIHLTGNSGVGKSTTAATLAATLGVPYISLDKLFWLPGWKKTPKDEFRAKIRAALDQSDRGWVLDGDYTKRLGDIVIKEATDIVWLDPPLLLYLPRLILRTVLRILRLRPQCSPGCYESVREVLFSKKSIVWWCLSNHWLDRRRNWAKMQQLGLGYGTASDHVNRKMRRIGGWGGELTAWLNQVKYMASR